MCCKLLKKREKLLQKNVRFTIEKPMGGGGQMKMGRRFFERGRPKEESKKQRSEDYA